MQEMFNTLIFYFSFPFVRYALIVGMLIALCASLLGVTLVLKRYSLIGVGLSHIAFAATAIAGVLHLTNTAIFVLPVTIISAILLLRQGQNAKVKGDAVIAMIAVGTLALGYLIMNMFSVSANLAGDVCTIMFGATTILTLSSIDMWLSLGLSIAVIAVFIIFYNKIFSITFDEDFSLATGGRAKLYNLILSVIIAIIIVLAINLVGALLISALVIFPALSAMRIFKTFKSVTICSVIVAVMCSALGMIVSILAGTPVGSTVVAVNIAIFIGFWALGFFRKKLA